MNFFKKKQPALRDISASFHPVENYHPSGAMSSWKYNEERIHNKKCFYRSCSAENDIGGMIVCPGGNGAALEKDILSWLGFFAGGKHWNVGRCFGGHYTIDGHEFGDVSVTVDLWDISWQEVIQTAVNLQKNFCQCPVLIKNFSTGAVWLMQYTK